MTELLTRDSPHVEVAEEHAENVFSGTEIVAGALVASAGVTLTLLNSPVLLAVGMGVLVAVLGLAASWAAVTFVR